MCRCIAAPASSFLPRAPRSILSPLRPDCTIARRAQRRPRRKPGAGDGLRCCSGEPDERFIPGSSSPFGGGVNVQVGLVMRQPAQTACDLLADSRPVSWLSRESISNKAVKANLLLKGLRLMVISIEAVVKEWSEHLLLLLDLLLIR